MSILEVKDIAHRYGAKEIFNEINFKILNNEHIGLVGTNGAGKSTLMKIIAKKTTAEEGEIIWRKEVRVGYMDQHLDIGAGITIMQYLHKSFDFLFDLEKEMITGYEKMADCTEAEMEEIGERCGVIGELLDKNNFYQIDTEIKKVGSGLGIDQFGFDTMVDNLSGGQRTKLLLVSLLLKKPDILLLDEPTNYLDVGHIDWLKKYLISYENAFILISHDTPFLNACSNVILNIENQKMDRYTGNYEYFVAMREQKLNREASEYSRQQNFIKKQEEFISKNIARASTSTRAKSRQKQLDKIDRVSIAKELSPPIFIFQEARQPSKVVFKVNDLSIGYNGKPLSVPLNLSVERGQKIALTGTNGLGKTTLLNTLLEIIKPVSGTAEKGQFLEIGHFIQEDKSKTTKTCLEEAWESMPIENRNHQYVRTSLAKCGLKKEHVDIAMSQLSGGEQAKVRLCKILNNASNVLILDEPTNHLDKVAKAELKKSLINYNGTILIVCHEPEFYNGLVDDIWDCSKWSLQKK